MHIFITCISVIYKLYTIHQLILFGNCAFFGGGQICPTNVSFLICGQEIEKSLVLYTSTMYVLSIHAFMKSKVFKIFKKPHISLWLAGWFLNSDRLKCTFKCQNKVSQNLK